MINRLYLALMLLTLSCFAQADCVEGTLHKTKFSRQGQSQGRNLTRLQGQTVVSQRAGRRRGAFNQVKPVHLFIFPGHATSLGKIM